MKVLVTGGAGFIGSTLALELIERGHQVRILDNLSTQIHGSNPHNSFLYLKVKDHCQIIVGDVRKKSHWKIALENQDVVVHFAAETGTGQSMYKIQEYVETNVLGTSILLDFLANETHQIRKVVIASSRAIYGEGKYTDSKGNLYYPNPRHTEKMAKGNFELIHPETNEKLTALATDEESKIHPISVYGITKQNQEEMILSVCKSLGISAIALRYQNVYGPGQSLSNPYTGILSIFSNLLLNNQHINIFEDGLMTRDFVYIDDVVRATYMSIEDTKIENDYFNVGTGENVTVLKVAQTLKNIYQSNSELEVSGNFRIGDIRHNFADMNKSKKLLGFEPKIQFDQGILNFSDWVKKQHIEKNDHYEQSIQEMSKKGLFK